MIASSPNHGYDLDDFKAFLSIAKNATQDLIKDVTPPELQAKIQYVKAQTNVMIALIDSMTTLERSDHRLIDALRSARITRGAGANKWQLKKMLHLYEIMVQTQIRQ